VYRFWDIEIAAGRRYGPLMAREPGGRSVDPGTRLVLKELRGLRVELRADRRERRRADTGWRDERRQADDTWKEERRQAEESWKEERRQMDEAWKEERRLADEAWKEERRLAEEAHLRELRQLLGDVDEQRRRDRQESDERFQQALREFREDSVRHFEATQKAFGEVRAVGLSIVKTLNLHTRLLQRIDRKLGPPGPWRYWTGDGRNA
jgi:hypothetical protein